MGKDGWMKEFHRISPLFIIGLKLFTHHFNSSSELIHLIRRVIIYFLSVGLLNECLLNSLLIFLSLKWFEESDNRRFNDLKPGPENILLWKLGIHLFRNQIKIISFHHLRVCYYLREISEHDWINLP